MTCLRFTPFVRRLLASCLFVFALFTSVFAADKKTFDIPAGTADKSLKQFTVQSGAEVIYPAEIVRGVKTPAVKGEMTLEEAIQRLLADTTLNVKRDEKSSTFMISRDPNAQRVAQTEKSVHPTNSSSSGETTGVLKLETFEVTGSRLRTTLDSTTIQPVVAYTRKDLDRYGINSMEDLQTYVPQLPPFDWTTQAINGSSGNARINFGQGLRGLGNTATLVLVDGRRVNKLGQNQEGTEAYDLNGIPFSAIERIEILTDGASAIYGSDALAGVINIILKKDYTGTELKGTYGNTFDTDTAYRNVQLSHGFKRGPLSLNISLNTSKTNSLSLRDRDFSASRDRRPFGGGNGLASAPLGGRGVVRSTTGANLPGLNSSVAAIPAGSTGINLSIADFANSGALPAPFDYNQFYTAGTQKSLNARFGGKWEVKPWLQGFADISWSRAQTFTSGIYAPLGGPFTFQQFRLPANYPGNPFGEPILLERPLWELEPLTHIKYTVDTNRVLVGLRGNFAENWRYELGIQRQASTYDSNGFATFYVTALRNAVNGAVAADRPILLNDGLANSPNSPDLWQRIGALARGAAVNEQPAIWSYDFKADGSLWQLPSGTVQTAVGVEAREEYAHFTTGDVPNQKRTSVGTFAEVQVPIVGPEQRITFVQKLSVNVSARADHYSDFGGKVVPRFGLLYAPTAKLIVRAGYGQGYKVPDLFEFYSPYYLNEYRGIYDPLTFADVLDPRRGNEAVAGTLPVIEGGNPDLRPENSESRTAGLVFGLPTAGGFSLSLDYYDIRSRNRVVIPDFPTLIGFFEERVTREPTSAADAARGFVGPVIGFDDRYLNIAFIRVTGFDAELRFTQALADGKVLFRLGASIPRISTLVTKEGAEPFDNKPAQPWRGTGAVSWANERIELGAAVTYTGAYYFGFTPDFTGVPVHAVTLLDLNAAYTFTKSEATRSMIGKALAGTTLRAVVYNVLGKRPQLGPETNGQSAGSVDPRGRRYVLSFTKQF